MPGPGGHVAGVAEQRVRVRPALDCGDQVAADQRCMTQSVTYGDELFCGYWLDTARECEVEVEGVSGEWWCVGLPAAGAVVERTQLVLHGTPGGGGALVRRLG